jgi:hypothetical protein
VIRQVTPPLLHFQLGVLEHAVRHRGQINRLPPGQPHLSPGEGEQGVDQAFLLNSRSQNSLVGGSQAVDIGFRVRPGDLGEGALASEGGAQLVGGVGNESALGFERFLQAGGAGLNVWPSSLSSSSGPSVGMRALRLVAGMSRAAAVMVRSGRRTRAATIQLRPMDRAAMAARAISEYTRSWRSSSLCCRAS